MARGGGPARFVDLVEALPARRGEGGGEQAEAVLGGIGGRGLQTQGEAAQAAAAAFGLVLQALHGGQPPGVVVVGVHKVQALAGNEADGLLFARFVFLARIDVGVAVKDGGAYAVGQHTLYYGGRTGGTARMQQHVPVPVGCL